jgi:hypothetical protein
MPLIWSRHIDWEDVYSEHSHVFVDGVTDTRLKLALSIHNQPIFTTHRPSDSDGVALFGGDVHGLVRSGSKNPLSLANCSRHIGRNSVRETITKTSLVVQISIHGWIIH